MSDHLFNQLSYIVSPMIGHHISEDQIYTDKDDVYDWSYCIPAHSLEDNHPLILYHYNGTLFMILPQNDYHRLKNQDFSVGYYVSSATWSYGYFRGGSTIFSGVYWQTLEQNSIKDTELISKYLDSIKQSSNLKDSFGEKEDPRKTLFELVQNRIWDNFRFETRNCLLHAEDTDIWMFPRREKDSVLVYLPQKILMGLLYHPEKYHLISLVDSWQIQLGIPTDSDKAAPRIKIPQKDENITTAYDTWLLHCPEHMKYWGIHEQRHVKKKNPTLIEKIKSLFPQR